MAHTAEVDSWDYDDDYDDNADALEAMEVASLQELYDESGTITTDYHQRYCLECIHFELSLGAPVYEYTEAAYMKCNKDHWYLGCRDDYEKYYKKRICTARACPDFEPDPELAEISKGGQANEHWQPGTGIHTVFS